jgi:cytidine deaminase
MPIFYKCSLNTLKEFTLKTHKQKKRRTVAIPLQPLIDAAESAMSKSIAPYSHFHVGAALTTSSGKIYDGHNIETSSYSLTICAERVALFKALSEGEREFEQLVLVASNGEFCPPCGACRQTLIDFAPDLKITLLDKAHRTKQFLLKDLLPEFFSAASMSASPSPAVQKKAAVKKRRLKKSSSKKQSSKK